MYRNCLGESLILTSAKSLCIYCNIRAAGIFSMSMDIQNQPPETKPPEAGRPSVFRLPGNIGIQTFQLLRKNRLRMGKLGAEGL